MKNLIIITVSILLIAFTAWAGPRIGPGGPIRIGNSLGIYNNVAEESESSGDALLLETGDYLLLETGDKLLLE